MQRPLRAIGADRAVVPSLTVSSYMANVWRLLALAVVPALLVSACSGSTTSTPDGTGQVSFENGGARITVPALWAGVDASGEPVGGVELAEIFVSTASATPEYRVDLADIEAQGAGESWQAATSMASAFATVFAAVDPATVDLNFTITGPINGPSAGGILTVGLLAAFQGQSLSPGFTMTGTITADGSIGPVGGVLTKIEAAAREGFTNIVLPVSLTRDDWASGNAFTELADELGVTLFPVHTIGEAYAAMTGAPIEKPDLSAGPPLSDPTQNVTEEIAATNIDALANLIAESSFDEEPELASWAQQQLDNARRDLDLGELAVAYGNANFALTQLTRSNAALQVERALDANGMETTRADLTLQAQQVRDAAATLLTQGSQQPVVGLSQCFALPTALGWAAFSQVTMEGVIAELTDTNEATALIPIAQAIAEAQLGTTTFGRQAIDVVMSLDVGSGEDCSAVSQHLSDYSRFLVRAAQASSGYLGDVLGTDLDAGDMSLQREYTAGARIAEQLANTVTPQVEQYSDEAQQFATSLTYFWLTSYAVAAKQAYEVLPGSTAADLAAMRQTSMDIAVDQTWWFIKFRAEILSQQELDPGAAVWSARWALEESLTHRSGPYATDANWLALGELWYDAVQMTTMLSYISPTEVASE
jgi:hypothetical protein